MEKLLDKFIEINEKYIELKLELEMLKSKGTIKVSELAKYFEISSCGEYVWIQDDTKKELSKLLRGELKWAKKKIMYLAY